MDYYSEEAKNAVIPNKSMYKFVYDNNVNRQNNTAYVYFERTFSYGKIFEMVDRLASALVRSGIHQGDVIIIDSVSTPETIALIYAINKIGAISDFCPITSSEREILEEIEIVNAKMIFILEKVIKEFRDDCITIPIIAMQIGLSACGIEGILLRLSEKKTNYTSIDCFMNSSDALAEEMKCENIGDLSAIILHTSGTTGTPKFAVLSNNNINSVAVQIPLTGKNYSPNDIYLNMLPPFISFGIGMTHLFLSQGCKVVALLVPSVKGVAQMLKKYRPTRFTFGPAVIDVITKCPNKDLSHLIDLSAGGAAISLDMEKNVNTLLNEKNAKTYYLAGYGMTELAGAFSANHNDKRKIQSAGIPFGLNTIKVVDLDTGEELGYDQEGELLVSGPSVMKEYLDNKEETDRIIETDKNGTRWLHTGDLAKIDNDGFFFITGRIKRIYTTLLENDVFKLFPQRLEDLIIKIDDIDHVGVICVKDKERQHVPVVFAEIKKGADSSSVKEQMIRIISENTPQYYEPKDIIFVSNLPITTSQKVDYKLLEKMYLGRT